MKKKALQAFAEYVKTTRGARSPAADPADLETDKIRTAAGQKPTGAGTKPAPTDDAGLRATDTVYVSTDEGTTNEAFPKPDIEYDFCAFFENTAKLPSGPFFVKFKLSGDKDWHQDFDMDDGLQAGASVLAVVHFGKFPDKKADYRLSACIYSTSAPDKSITCAGEFGFPIGIID